LVQFISEQESGRLWNALQKCMRTNDARVVRRTSAQREMATQEFKKA
tara:strand:+ start:266 stop:406 length:141 start_codon:yes stop_codon:yes gene_type:complete